MGEIIAIMSGKGGVGKTVLTANIGAELAKDGSKVVLVDADVGLCNLDLALGVESRVNYNIADALEGSISLEQAMIRDDRFDNLYLLPTSQVSDRLRMAASEIRSTIEELSDSFDFVLIDCPAGVNEWIEDFISCIDCALVVTLPEITALRDAKCMIRKLKVYGVEKIRIILNRMPTNSKMEEEYVTRGQVSDMLGSPLLGVLPEDSSVSAAVNTGILLSKTSLGEPLRNIAKRIVGEEIPFCNFRKKRLLEKIRGIFMDW